MPFAEVLLPLLVSAHADVDGEVRSNSVYSTGLLCQSAGPSFASHYPQLLRSMYINCFDAAGNPEMVSCVRFSVPEGEMGPPRATLKGRTLGELCEEDDLRRAVSFQPLESPLALLVLSSVCHCTAHGPL